MISCMETGNIAERRAFRAEHAKGEIIIGAAYPGTKRLTVFRQGIEMAAEEVNAAGGVLGRKVRLVFRDDERSLSQGMMIAEEFGNNMDMVAFIGHIHSDISVPVSILYDYYGLLMMSPVSTAPKLTRQGFQLVFRNIPDNQGFAIRLADLSHSQGFKRMMIYNVRDEFGRTLANAFEARAWTLGIEILDRSEYSNSATTDNLKKSLTHWKEYYSFDAIFLAGLLPQSATIISTARSVGITVPIVTSNPVTKKLLKIAGEAAEGTLLVSSFEYRDPDPLVQKFTKVFGEKYGVQPSAAAAQGYDALKVLAYAMTKARSTVPAKVAEVLHSTKNWHGVTGYTTFDKKGDVVGKEMNWLVVRNGKYEYIDASNR